MILTRFLGNLIRRNGTGEAQHAQATTPISDNPLEEFFFNHSGRLIDKWHHYFEIYHRHFAAFRERSPVVVEIGVSHGGSLQMWRDYFGPGARIVGVDVDPRCQQFNDEGTFLEYSKALVDHLYAWYSRDPDLIVGNLTRSTFALHFYDSVLVMEKRPMVAPKSSRIGTPSF